MISALSRRNEFALVQRSGASRRSGPLRARVVLAEQPTQSVQLGFTIGRSFGNAVERNRMRRRLRHCVAQVVTHDSSIATTHVLMGASRAALVVSHPELVAHCRELMTIETSTGVSQASTP